MRPFVAAALLCLLVGASLSNLGTPAYAQNPTDLQAIEEQVSTLLEAGRAAEALSFLRQELARAERTDDQVRILWIVAWIELQSGRASAADVNLRDAARLSPDLPFPPVYGAPLRDRWYAARELVQRENERRAHDLVTRGLSQQRAGNLADARRYFEEALQSVPDHPEALVDLGLLESTEGHTAEAIAAFERVTALATRRPEVVSKETLVLSLTQLGALYDRRGLPEEAQRVLREALDRDARHGAAWLHLGRSLRSTGHLEESRQALERARSYAPDDSVAADELATTLGELGQWNQAASLLVSATRDDPSNAALWLHLGQAQQSRDDVAGARESFARALSLDTTGDRGIGGGAALLLAVLEWRSRDWEACVRAALKATEIDTSSVPAWIYLGLGRESLGDLQNARAAYEEATSIDPRSAAGWANLGRVSEQLGDRSSAANAYEQAVTLDPTLPGAEEGLARTRGGAPLATSSAPPISRSSHGRTPPPVTRPRLGLHVADIDYAALGMNGILIERIDRGGMADRSGLRPEDLLLRANGQPLQSFDDLLAIVRHAGSSPVRLDLLRNQRPLVVELEP